MPSVYGAVKKMWDRLPTRIKYVVDSKLGRLKVAIRDVLITTAGHDEIYDRGFYQWLDQTSKLSFRVIAETIAEDFAPNSAIDVGCGTGGLLEQLKLKGINVVGLEYSDEALKICSSRGLGARQFDLETDVWDDPRRFDLVVSTEVAEHLHSSSANRYVDLLCSLGNTILFTAATPGQGGNDHLNEQPHEYWINLFSARAFVFDLEHSSALRTQWQSKNTNGWYHRNVMVFRKG